MQDDMNRGAQALNLWTRRDGMTRDEAAEALGLKVYTLDSLRSGRRRPSLDVAVRIEDRTAGYVRVRDWVS